MNQVITLYQVITLVSSHTLGHNYKSSSTDDFPELESRHNFKSIHNYEYSHSSSISNNLIQTVYCKGYKLNTFCVLVIPESRVKICSVKYIQTLPSLVALAVKRSKAANLLMSVHCLL